MKDEKIARALRVIAYLLCAILLMEVILFAGITSFADSVVNLLDYSQFQLNTRIRQVGELGSQNGIAVTNIIDVRNQTRIYFYDLNNFTEIQSTFNVFAMSQNADMSNSVGYLWFDYYHQVDEHISYIEFPVFTYEYRYFRINYIPQYPLVTITSTAGWTLKANFTGDFTDEEPSRPSILALYADFSQGIPNILTNLANLIYDENGLTTIGTALCVICGAGTVFSIIKFILNTLKGGK